VPLWQNSSGLCSIEVQYNIESLIPQVTAYLKSNPHIIFAYLFGSLAKGKQQPLSDVDIAVYLKQGASVVECKLAILGRLIDILQTDEIDLVVLNAVNLPLVINVLKSKKIIVDKEPFKRQLYSKGDICMVDETLILRKLSELDEYYGQIKEYDKITVAQYSDDWKIQRIIERTLQMMIETCVDIASHIIADKGYRVPKSYSDTFKVLHEENIVSSKLFNSLNKMAKFRNIVVHHYDNVDAEIVVGILKKDLKDFMSYKNAIISFLKSKNEQ